MRPTVSLPVGGELMDRATKVTIAASLREAANALTAAGDTDADALAARIEETVRKVFPKAGIRVTVSNNLMPSINLWFALQGDPSKHANRIPQNDPAYGIFTVWGIGKDGSVPEKLTVEATQGTSLTVQPAPDSRMAYDRVKFGWRKKSGNADAIVKHIGNYFTKVKKVVKENFDRLPKSFDSEGLGLDR